MGAVEIFSPARMEKMSLKTTKTPYFITTFSRDDIMAIWMMQKMQKSPRNVQLSEATMPQM